MNTETDLRLREIYDSTIEVAIEQLTANKLVSLHKALRSKKSPPMSQYILFYSHHPIKKTDPAVKIKIKEQTSNVFFSDPSTVGRYKKEIRERKMLGNKHTSQTKTR